MCPNGQCCCVIMDSVVVSYNCNSVRNNVETVRILTNEYDIILLQELMLLKQDVHFLKSINDSFDCIALCGGQIKPWFTGRSTI